MNKKKIIRHIEQKSMAKAGRFARQLMHSKSEDKEEILAGLEFEKWMARLCRDCLD